MTFHSLVYKVSHEFLQVALAFACKTGRITLCFVSRNIFRREKHF